MRAVDLLSVGEIAERSGFAPSALRYYEREGLISAQRTAGGQRRYQRIVLRRLAFIAAARHVGLTLEEIGAALATLPEGRTPTRADWNRISERWRSRLDTEIAALEALRYYHWPGNVRELQHVIERAVILSDSDSLKPEEILFSPSAASRENGSAPDHSLFEVEKKHIEMVIRKHDGSVTAAAKELGLTRTALYRRIRKYGI